MAASRRPADEPPDAAYERARAILHTHFGYPDFRAPQVRAVQAVLSGRDALIVLPTGGGKSLCYQVPALARDGLTVVVSPLISLMQDQVDALERRHIAATYLNSTLDRDTAAARLARARNGALKLLYLAPERLEAERMLQQLAGIGVSLLAIDEAHCISEWGHDFRPSYRRIGDARERLGRPQTVALTATATPSVRADITQQLRLRRAVVVVGGFDRTNLTYHVVPAPRPADKDRLAVQWLRAASGPAIVYAPTRRAVERVTSVLIRARINAVAYHAGLDDGVRHRAQDAFMRERVRVIVATSAFGMGIDKPDVRLVVHHAMPGSLEAYYQEAGRAGRDGATSTCVLLYRFDDRVTHEYFIDGAHPERSLVERVFHALGLAHARGAPADSSTPAIRLEDVLRHMPRGTDARRVGAALRVLVAGGVAEMEPESSTHVWVRLLAAPSRIRAELGTGPSNELLLLRALWRESRLGAEEGAVVSLRGLSHGQQGANGIVPVLQRLESTQMLMWRRIGGGFRLHRHGQPPHRLPVDWSALARRRQADMSRLEAMQQYSQTRACRRAFVLRYFGDPAARTSCNACDRCLAPSAPLVRIRSRTTGRRPAFDASNRSHGR